MNIQRIQNDNDNYHHALHENPDIEQTWKTDLEKLEKATKAFARENNLSESLEALKYSYYNKMEALRRKTAQKEAELAALQAELAALKAEEKNLYN